MVFSSLPLYLDPFNYFQVQQQQVDTIGGIENLHLIPPPPPPPPIIDEGGGAGLLKPNSMAEQARLANIPQPETALKCPRCESTNTKFCYYNNYNLSQPRHFCKTCKRYWTRGGALRSVPVGGGLRRNKRNKNSTSRSKSSSTISDQKRQTGSSSTSTTVNSSNSCNNTDLIGHLPPQLQPLQQLPFWPSSSHNNLTADFASSGFNYFGSTPQSKVVTAGFDVDNELIQFGDRTSDVDSILTSGIVEQWRVQEEIQKFPLLANLEPSINTGLYPNFHETSSTANNIDQSSYLNLQVRSKLQLDSGVTRSANLKMEENNNIERLDLSRNLLGSLGNDRQYWASGSGSGNAWTDISSDFISSSTS